MYMHVGSSGSVQVRVIQHHNGSIHMHTVRMRGCEPAMNERRSDPAACARRRLLTLQLLANHLHQIQQVSGDLGAAEIRPL